MRTHRYALLALLVILPAVRADEPAPKKSQAIAIIELNRQEPVLYEKDIEPIFVNKCQTCHSGPVKEGKFDMGTYESVVKGGKHGKSLVPGKSADSLLVQMSGKTVKPYMPPKDEVPLTPEELALIKLWIDQGAKAPVGIREKPKAVVGQPHPAVHPVRALVLSPDKSMLAASRGNQLHVYDAVSGAFIRSVVDPDLMVGAERKPLAAAHLSLIESLACSPDGKWLASGSYQEVILWDAQTGALKARLTGFADRVGALAFSPNSKLLATGGGAPTEDGEIKVFDVETGKPTIELKSPHSDTVYGVAFSPDGTMLASGGADKFVKTWEVATGKFVKAFEGHTHHVLDVAWKSDGKLLASCSADNTIKVWDFEKGEQARTIKDQHSKQITRMLSIGPKPEVVTCSGDQTVRIFNIDSGGGVRTFTGSQDFLYAVGTSADGAVIATGGEEGVVRLYNGTNGQLVKSLLPPDAVPAEVKK